jgi:hypothetical protein
MGHALYVPALGKHVYAHNASDMLARSPFRAYRVDHLAEYGAEKSPDRSSGERRLPGDAFAASNFMSTNDPKAADKLMAGQPEGGMLIWRPKTGWEDVPEAATISADNGVAASPDGKQLFVAGSGDETVVRLSLDGTPGDRAVIKTGFHTDNLRWGSDGFLYASGQR